MFLFARLIVFSVLTNQVWSLATEAKGVAEDDLKSDNTRSKRQYYDYLHYLIEKQARCAGEHLTPLTPRGPFRPYDLFVYPHGLSQPGGGIMNIPNIQPVGGFMPGPSIFPAFYNSGPPQVYSSLRPISENRGGSLVSFSAGTYVNPPTDCDNKRHRAKAKPRPRYKGQQRNGVNKGLKEKNAGKNTQDLFSKENTARAEENKSPKDHILQKEKSSPTNSTHVVIVNINANNCTCSNFTRNSSKESSSSSHTSSNTPAAVKTAKDCPSMTDEFTKPSPESFSDGSSKTKEKTVKTLDGSLPPSSDVPTTTKADIDPTEIILNVPLPASLPPTTRTGDGHSKTNESLDTFISPSADPLTPTVADLARSGQIDPPLRAPPAVAMQAGFERTKGSESNRSQVGFERANESEAIRSQVGFETTEKLLDVPRISAPVSNSDKKGDSFNASHLPSSLTIGERNKTSAPSTVSIPTKKDELPIIIPTSSAPSTIADTLQIGKPDTPSLLDLVSSTRPQDEADVLFDDSLTSSPTFSTTTNTRKENSFDSTVEGDNIPRTVESLSVSPNPSSGLLTEAEVEFTETRESVEKTLHSSSSIRTKEDFKETDKSLNEPLDKPHPPTVSPTETTVNFGESSFNLSSNSFLPPSTTVEAEESRTEESLNATLPPSSAFSTLSTFSPSSTLPPSSSSSTKPQEPLNAPHLPSSTSSSGTQIGLERTEESFDTTHILSSDLSISTEGDLPKTDESLDILTPTSSVSSSRVNIDSVSNSNSFNQSRVTLSASGTAEEPLRAVESLTSTIVPSPVINTTNQQVKTHIDDSLNAPLSHPTASPTRDRNDVSSTEGSLNATLPPSSASIISAGDEVDENLNSSLSPSSASLSRASDEFASIDKTLNSSSDSSTRTSNELPSADGTLNPFQSTSVGEILNSPLPSSSDSSTRTSDDPSSTEGILNPPPSTSETLKPPHSPTSDFSTRASDDPSSIDGTLNQPRLSAVGESLNSHLFPSFDSSTGTSVKLSSADETSNSFQSSSIGDTLNSSPSPSFDSSTRTSDNPLSTEGILNPPPSTSETFNPPHFPSSDSSTRISDDASSTDGTLNKHRSSAVAENVNAPLTPTIGSSTRTSDDPSSTEGILNSSLSTSETLNPSHSPSSDFSTRISDEPSSTDGTLNQPRSSSVSLTQTSDDFLGAGEFLNPSPDHLTTTSAKVNDLNSRKSFNSSLHQNRSESKNEDGNLSVEQNLTSMEETSHTIVASEDQKITTALNTQNTDDIKRISQNQDLVQEKHLEIGALAEGVPENLEMSEPRDFNPSPAPLSPTSAKVNDLNSRKSFNTALHQIRPESKNENENLSVEQNLTSREETSDTIVASEDQNLTKALNTQNTDEMKRILQNQDVTQGKHLEIGALAEGVIPESLEISKPREFFETSINESPETQLTDANSSSHELTPFHSINTNDSIVLIQNSTDHIVALSGPPAVNFDNINSHELEQASQERPHAPIDLDSFVIIDGLPGEESIENRNFGTDDSVIVERINGEELKDNRNTGSDESIQSSEEAASLPESSHERDRTDSDEDLFSHEVFPIESTENERSAEIIHIPAKSSNGKFESTGLRQESFRSKSNSHRQGTVTVFSFSNRQETNNNRHESIRFSTGSKSDDHETTNSFLNDFPKNPEVPDRLMFAGNPIITLPDTKSKPLESASLVSLSDNNRQNLKSFSANFHSNSNFNPGDQKESLPSVFSNKQLASVGFSSEFENEEPDEQFSEPLNLEADRSQVRPTDMTGTGTRYIKYLKRPNGKENHSTSQATFAEPIISKIYTGKKQKSKSRSPLSIYWHKIEPKSPAATKSLKELRPFMSGGFDDVHDEDFVSVSEECSHYDDIFEESKKLKSKPNFSKLFNCNTHFT